MPKFFTSEWTSSTTACWYSYIDGEKQQQALQFPLSQARRIEVKAQNAGPVLSHHPGFLQRVKVRPRDVGSWASWKPRFHLWYERLCFRPRARAASAHSNMLSNMRRLAQFGLPSTFQAVPQVGDMKILRISRTLVYRFAWLMSQEQATRHDAAVLKLYTGETYKSVSDMGLQILGGYGYCMEYPMQRFFRDSRLATIGAGTSEIQRNIIARGLGL